jgi:hypothetical protein
MTDQDRKSLLRAFRWVMVLYTGASVAAVGLQLRLPIALTSEDHSRKISQIAGAVALIFYGGLCWEILSGQVDKARRRGVSRLSGIGFLV